MCSGRRCSDISTDKAQYQKPHLKQIEESTRQQLVQYMARRSMYNVLGTLGTNRVVLRHKCGVPRNKCVFSCLYMTREEDIHRANMIRELLQVRDGQLDVWMSQCEMRTLLEYVCRAYYVNVAP